MIFVPGLKFGCELRTMRSLNELSEPHKSFISMASTTSAWPTTAPLRAPWLSGCRDGKFMRPAWSTTAHCSVSRSEEHTSEFQSLRHLVCRLLLEKKKNDEHADHDAVTLLTNRACISQRAA